MLSFGWTELALTAVIVIIIVGPKEIPNLLRQIGSFTKSIKKVTRDFKSSLNEIANETELNKVNKSLSEIKNELDPTNEIKSHVDNIKKNTKIFEKEINNLNSLDNQKNK